MQALKRESALRREFSAAERIPYRTHVAPTVIRTQFGDYVQALRIGGASFETRDDAELNNWHARLNVLWRNIASSRDRAVVARHPPIGFLGRTWRGNEDAIRQSLRRVAACALSPTP